jgi:signal transduction histidine kinase/CheY-like chemotaxis protein
MKKNRFIIYLLIAFITGTILLIYIQFNSAKNISALIDGNNKYLDEYKINSELKGLEKDLVKIESNTSNLVSTNDADYIKDIRTELNIVRYDLDQLQKIAGDDSTVKKIDELDTAVQRALLFHKAVMDSFYSNGKASAEKLIGTLKGKRLMDSIYSIAQNIENTRHDIIRGLTLTNDKNGQKAQRFNTTLIGLVLVCGAGLFWFIIDNVRRRESLIQQLHKSEIMIKETARVKEHFMANMSHEIRTPMNVILGFTNLLQRRNLDEESAEYTGAIRRAAENLLTIIDDILDLSKIEAGMLRIESAPFSIRSLLHSVEVMFASKAAEKGIRIFATIDDAVPDSLEGDATRLTQILINLVGNALKFTKKGSVSIKISDEGRDGDIMKTGITIADTGIGIEEEQQPKIFDRFQQADNTVTRHYGGTGLGLSIVKELVQLQNGTIAVESQTGLGTRFTLMIPYKLSVTTPVPPVTGEATLNNSHYFAGLPILVVEDNEINQSLVRHLFKNWGLPYDLAQNGREAIEQLREKKYSLILMDIQMPVMDGYTATRFIRETLGLSTPIIAMTAHALSGEKEKCLSYGMDDYISKPIREDKLYQLITQYTQMPAMKKGQNASGSGSAAYACINLQYMKAISGGNKEYEKTVTKQFIEAIPADLSAIEKAWKDQQIAHLRQMAHNMKTTVSVMGLYETLQPYLDALEYQELTEASFPEYFHPVKSICKQALQEASQFLETC